MYQYKTKFLYMVMVLSDFVKVNDSHVEFSWYETFVFEINATIKLCFYFEYHAIYVP